MGKNVKDKYVLENALLLDFYGGLLTPKAYEISDLYFNEDMSLSEISEELGITRQAVHDTLRRSARNISDYEKKLGLMDRFIKNKIAIENAVKDLDEGQIALAREKLIELTKNI